MRAKPILPLAVLLAMSMGGAVVAQGSPPAAKSLSKQEIQAFQREGSIAENLETAYASAVQAHAASLQGREQVALNQVYETRARLTGIRNLKLSDPDLERGLNDLLNLTTLAQRRLGSRSPAASDALKELVLRFSQTMATLPQLGGGGGAPAAPILVQKLAPELVTDTYRALANAQIGLAQGKEREAAFWLDEAQNNLQAARTAPGNERVQDLVSAVSPAIQVAQLQLSQKSPEAVASTAQAIEQMANRISAIR